MLHWRCLRVVLPALVRLVLFLEDRGQLHRSRGNWQSADTAMDGVLYEASSLVIVELFSQAVCWLPMFEEVLLAYLQRHSQVSSALFRAGHFSCYQLMKSWAPLSCCLISARRRIRFRRASWSGLFVRLRRSLPSSADHYSLSIVLPASGSR